MIEIRTTLFSTDPEGDLRHCNGKPGNRLAAWIRDKLTERGYDCADVIQEDYGWGFYIDEKIWVSVGLMDDQSDPTPQWAISADHDAPFNPMEWFKKRERKATATKILSDIKAALATDPDISIVGES